MKSRLLSLAVVPAALLGPCGPKQCGTGEVLDLEFGCKYSDGTIDFLVTNKTGSTMTYVAYDAEPDGFRLVESSGDADFAIGPYDFEIHNFTSEFELHEVLIAAPGPAPGEPGFTRYDVESVGSTMCIED